MPHNRWLVVLGAVLIQLSLGAIYIYSIFKPALKAHFPSWSATDLALPSQAVLAAFALSMVVSGRLQDRFGPKRTAIAGAFLLLAGMYVAAKAAGLFQFILGFGVLAGAGIGAAYVCPIAACVKWFPDKRGLVTGIAVAGFGAGSLIFAPVASMLISQIGIMASLFYLGLIYFFAIIIGALLMKNPSAGYCPPGAQPQVNQNLASNIEFTPREMIKNPQFFRLWFTYFIGCSAGLLVIMNLANIWQSAALINIANTQEVISNNQFAAIMRQGVLAVMVVAIFNSLGRIVSGYISDRIGRQKTMAIIFVACGSAMVILAGLSSFALFLLAVSLIGFCFGGFLALYPAATADNFGVKNIGSNYGLMFSAYGAAGLIGPWLAPRLISNLRNIPYENAETAIKVVEVGSYSVSLILIGLLCYAAAFVVFNAKQKKAASR